LAFKTPQQTALAALTAGTVKTRTATLNLIVGGFLAGAFIALGGLAAIAVTSGLEPARWGTLPSFFTGAVFSFGLMLVVIAGGELVTGNMALTPLALIKRRVSVGGTLTSLAIVLVANALGAVFVAYFLGEQTGILTTHLTLARLTAIATLKGHTETDWQIFLRGVGCNWLVCLAVWMAMSAEDIAGKVLAIFFPIMGFVAMGFDHVVANMFFLPAAIFAHVPGITWGDAVNNWLYAGIGNLIGAVLFVSTAYWFLYAREPSALPAQTPQAEGLAIASEPALGAEAGI
jgi:formate/nitrite transporter